MKRNVPKLRFKGFDGEWKEIRLGDFLDFYSTNSLSRDCLNNKTGEIKNIHYGDIHMNFPTILDSHRYSIPFINNDVDVSKFKQDGFCRDGDIIFADASEDYNDIGKAIEITNIGHSKIVAGLHTILARDNKKITSNGFKGYMMLNDTVRKQIKILAAGAKVLGISKTNLVKVKVNLPSLQEQEKIANFLTKVDSLIEEQYGKVKELELYKKGMMKKIFLQEIRLKDDNGCEYPDWEKGKIGNCFSERSKKGFVNLELLSVSINGGVCSRNEIDAKDNSSNDKSNYKLVEINDIVYNSMRMWQGASGISYKRGIVSPAYTVLIPKENISSMYFGYLFKWNKIIYEFKKYSQGLTSDTWNLKYPQIKDIKINIPCIQEQTKIANFLSKIDLIIEEEKNKLEDLRQWKKGLLQQMFV